eukprot:m.90197 g.90197  ORF g.90197 m.90197 type:complete len:482 (-) comp12911_c1_seq1:356-1801(-)
MAEAEAPDAAQLPTDAPVPTDVHTSVLQEYTEGVSAMTIAWPILATGDALGNLCVYHLERMAVLFNIKAHEHAISSLALGSNGRVLVSGSQDCTAALWDVENQGQELHRLAGHVSYVKAVAFAGSMVLTAGGDHNVIVWSVQTGQQAHMFRGHTDWVHSITVFQSQSELVACTSSWDCSLRVWEVETGRSRGLLDRHTSVARCVVKGFDPMTVVAGCVDGRVYVYNMVSDACLHEFQAHPGTITAMDRIGRKLVTGGEDMQLHVWDVISGNPLGSFSQHAAFISGLCCAPDGSVFSVDGDGGVFVWDGATYEALHSFKEHSAITQCGAAGNDESCFFIHGSSAGKVTLISLPTRETEDATMWQAVQPITAAHIPSSGSVLSAWFLKKGGWRKTGGIALSGRKKRWCVFEDGMVKYFAALSASGEPSSFKGTISITAQTQVETKDTKLLIRNPDRTWDMDAEDASTATEWCDAITSYTLSYA